MHRRVHRTQRKTLTLTRKERIIRTTTTTTLTTEKVTTTKEVTMTVSLGSGEGNKADVHR